MNLARGKAATASFTTTTPASQATVAGQRGRRLHDQRHPGHLRAPTSARTRSGATNGSPNAQDWLQVDLGRAEAVRPRQAVLLQQQGLGRERQHLQGAERVLGPVLRRLDLGGRPGQAQDAGHAGAELQRGRLPAGHRAAGARAGDEVDRARPARSASRRSRCSTPGPRRRRSGGVGGTVPATLALTLGAPASFGAFTPGVAQDYAASTDGERASPPPATRRSAWPTRARTPGT